MDKPYGFIYLVTNLNNGKVYVGQTSRTIANRFSVHKSEARRRARGYFHKAIAKHGESAFTVKELGRAESRDELNRLEREWIARLGCSDPSIGYNGTDGGDAASVGAAARIKMSLAKKGKPLSEAHKKRLSEVGRGRKQTEAHIKARADALRGRTPSLNCRLAVAKANRKRVISDETRLKLRQNAIKVNEARWGSRLAA